MERLLGQDSPQVGVLRIDLPAFHRFHPEYARLALMSGSSAARRASAGTRLGARACARPSPRWGRASAAAR